MPTIFFPDRKTLFHRMAVVTGPLATRDMEHVAAFLANKEKTVDTVVAETAQLLSALNNPPTTPNPDLAFAIVHAAAGKSQARYVERAHAKAMTALADGHDF